MRVLQNLLGYGLSVARKLQIVIVQANVFVVGDPDQAIYGWRGANVVNMQQSFAHDYPGDHQLSIDATPLASQHNGQLHCTLHSGRMIFFDLLSNFTWLCVDVSQWPQALSNARMSVITVSNGPLVYLT